MRKYILSALNDAGKKAAERYKMKYDAFYGWKVGQSLSGNEIKKALAVFFGQENTGEKIRTSTASSMGFSLLVEVYKNKFKPVDFNTLTHEDWLLVRNEYEAARKKEFEKTIGLISHNENIDFGKKKNKRSDDDEANSNSATGSYQTIENEELDDNDEINVKKKLELEINDLLDDVYLGNWGVHIRNKNEKYDYWVVILNSELDKSKFQKAVSELTSQYSDSIFNLKEINGQTYIEGFVNSEF